MWIIFPALVGISLAMDALAASVALGAAERKNFTWWKILLTAFAFGLFQMLMPDIGYFTVSLCGKLFIFLGKVTAFLLLALLGGKMIYEAVKKKKEREEEEENKGFSFVRLIVLSFATSIDALLVGVGYACLERGHILRTLAAGVEGSDASVVPVQAHRECSRSVVAIKASNLFIELSFLCWLCIVQVYTLGSQKSSF